MKKPDENSVLPDSVVESLSLAVPPAELGSEQRDRMRKRTLELARAASAEGTATQHGGEATWIEIAPHVEVRELWRDEHAGTHVSLLRMKPGGKIPAHRHTKDEDFIVLEGECHIGTHLLRTGDFHKASAHSLHADVTTQTGVLVLLRGEYPYPAAHGGG